MHTLHTLLLSLLPLLAAATTLTLSLPPHIPALPSSTRATLTTLGRTYTSPITRRNTFGFRNITQPGSYLLSVACRDYDVQGLRVDVLSAGNARDGDERMEAWSVKKDGGKGERVFANEDGRVELRVLGAREHYEERAGFNPMSLLKNPMILMGVAGLGLVFGMPYLMDNMDPEMKKEFEEAQKKSPLSGAAAGQNPLANFDMAGWMAGKTTGAGVGGGDDGGSGSGKGGGGGKRRG